MALAVERYSPQGELDGSAREISITFTDELVDLSLDDTKHMRLVESYIKITPMPQGKFVWQTARTVHFKPETPFLPFATNYFVTINPGIISRLGKILSQPLTFAFSTSPPKIVKSWPNRVSDSLSPIIFIAFDQRINPAEILQKIRVECGSLTISRSKFFLLYEDDIQQHEALKILSREHPPGHYLAFKLREELPRDTAVMVVVDQGAPSSEGAKTTPVPQFFQFSTFAVEAERIFRPCDFASQLLFKCSDVSLSIYSHLAIGFGDVDNDRDPEFVVGTASGDLVIFKYMAPWRCASQLQCIVAIAIGDVLNNKKNRLLAISAEGTAYIFDVDSAQPASSALPNVTSASVIPSSSSSSALLGNSSTTSTANTSSTALPLAASQSAPLGPAARLLAVTQTGGATISNLQSLLQNAAQSAPSPLPPPAVVPIPVNAQCVLIADIDGDGMNELVIGRSDSSVESFSLTSTASSRSVAISRKKSWKVRGEVSSLGCVSDENGKKCLLIGQQLGRYLVVNQEGTLLLSSTPLDNESLPTEIRAPFQLAATSSPSASSLTSVNSKASVSEKGSGAFITSCMNGTIRLNSLSAAQPLWEIDLSTPIFAPQIFHLRGARGGADCVAVCAPDGLTYLIDHERNMLQYKFPENVVAFAAGEYSLVSGQPQTCLIYITHENHIHLYYKLRLEDLLAADEPFGPFKKEISAALGIEVNPFQGREANHREWAKAEAPLLIESCVRNDFATEAAWQERKRLLIAQTQEKKD